MFPNQSYSYFLQNFLQSLVRFLCFSFYDFQFVDDLRDRAVGLSIISMNVAAGGDVIIVFLYFGVIDDVAEFAFLLPVDQYFGNFFDACFRDEIFRIALFEYPAGVDEGDFAFAFLRLGPVYTSHNARWGGVIEQVLPAV